jgi:TonB-linked SusC/RagA family outer membrane protein
MKKIVLMLLVLGVALTSAWAQQRTITGTVTSGEDGGTLPGVNVIIQGTTEGTITDIDGKYTISVPGNETVLAFSSVGFADQQMTVGNQSVIDIVMSVDVKSLDEIVITGYGSQVKRDITGAISSVKGEELARFNTPSFDQALQGQVTGVQVTSTSGVPGAPTRVMVRGTNSINAGTEPLWIVDGMVLQDMGGEGLNGFSRNASGAVGQNPLATLNPNDIKSVEVLKDAAATAIYGSRGSNGVIIVTTKEGEKGRGKTEFSITSGISNVLNGPEEYGFVDGPTWLALADESRANRGIDPFEPNSILDDGRDPTAVLEREQIANTNYFDQVLQQGNFIDLNLSASKGFEGGQYYLSGQYRKDEGILVGSVLERVSTRFNVDFEPVKNFSVGTRLNLSYTNQQRPPNGGAPGGNANTGNGGYNFAVSGQSIPILPLLHPTITGLDGNPILFDPLSGRNTLATLNRDNFINDLENYRALGNFFINYDLPFVEGLSLRSEVGFDVFQNSNIEYANTVIREESPYVFDFSNTRSRTLFNLYATYDKTFGDHAITVTAGVENIRQSSRSRNTEGQGITGTAKDLGGNAEILRASNGLGGELYWRGAFGRVNYKFKDRYLLGFSGRRDGVSIFTEDNRYALFLAASAGWIITEEDFFNVPGIDFLKLRASYGETGNYSIDQNATFTTYTGWGRYGDRSLGVDAGSLLTGIANPDITWETTEAIDVGVDFELVNNRITGTVGYYRQNARDLLFQVPIPQSSGIFSNANNIWNNVGDLRNEGFEFELNAVIIDKGDFRWRAGFNFTTNRNKILKLSGAADNEELYNVNNSPLVSQVGESIGYFRIARFAGVDPQGGYEMIQEMDTDIFEETGERVPTGNLIPATRANLETHLFDEKGKTGLPTYFGGFNNTFMYKGFELTAVLTFQGGNYIYDRMAANAFFVNGTRPIAQDLVGNYWQNPGDNVEYPSLSWNRRYDVINEDGSISENERFDNRRSGQVHDRFLQKGDFIRLRTLQLAYNLPANVANKIAMKGLRVFVGANNLFTITDFEGFDPEIVNLGGGASGRNTGQGWIGTQLPQLRSYQVGANFTF